MSSPPVSAPWRAAHVLALSSLAVTQPVLGVLGDNPTFFVAHHADRGEVLLVSGLVVFTVPVALIAVELLVGSVRRAWAWPVHLVVMGLLAAVVAAGVLDDLVAAVLDDLPYVSGPVTVLGAAGAGYAFTRAYVRRELLRSVVSVLAFAPAVFLGFFAFASPTRDLLFPEAVAAADVTVTGAQPPIFVVVFDELPLASVLTVDGDTIDAERFPNLARLADDGIWYPNATSVAAYTHEAVPAILTGNRVHDDNVPPTASGHPDNLFTFLAQDYDIAAYEQLTELCPSDLCEESSSGGPRAADDVLYEDLAVVAGHVTLPGLLEGWLPTINDTWANFGHDPVALDLEAERMTNDRHAFVDALGDYDRVGQFRAAVDEIQARRAPWLTFIHTVFPHVPWTYHADGSSYPNPGNTGLSDNEWTTSSGADFALQRHLLQAERADLLLGEFLDRLEAEGLYDDALVVFTADHGASFTVGTHRRVPEEDSLAGLMPVPLVVKPPATTPVADHRDDRTAETIDILPTIADLLDTELPWEVDGTSLVGPVPEAHERGIYAKGETVSTDATHLDVESVVDHIWDRFGVGDHLQLYGLGPDGALIDGPVAAVAGSGEDPEACWSAIDPVPGTTGWVSGRIETDQEGALDLGVVVGGRIAGTTTVYGTQEGDHRVFALADPALWSEDVVPSLWHITDGAWFEVPEC